MMKAATYTVGKKDLVVTWFSGTGAGGQHRNRHMNCCRIKHRDTGVTRTGQSHRDRRANQREALRNLANDPRFRNWCHLKLCEIERGITIEQKVEQMMDPKNLKVEIKDVRGAWVDDKRDWS